MWWSQCYRKTLILDGVQAGLSWNQQYSRYHGDKLCLSCSVVEIARCRGNSPWLSPSSRWRPRESRAGSLYSLAKPSVHEGRGHPGTPSGGQVMAPGFLCKATVPQSGTGVSLCPDAAGLLLWALFWGFNISSFGWVPSIAKGGEIVLSVIQLVIMLMFKERD